MTTIFFHQPPSSLFLLLTILFFGSSIHSESLLDHHKFPYRVSEIKFGGVLQGHGKRLLSEASNGKSTSLVLAAERTHRKDPLDHFRYYTGGWNISNDHYFASVAYTASPLVITAAVWFLVIGIVFLLSCIYLCCCGRRRRYGYYRVAHALSVVLLVLFTLVAIVGSIVLFIGQGKFHSSSTKTLAYVVNQADYTESNLKDVSAYLNAAKQAGVDQAFLPQQVQNNIDKISSQINSAATTLDTETKKNKDGIMSTLVLVRTLLIVVASVMLFVALLGFLLSIFGLQVLIYILVVIAWILVAGTFLLSGVFLVLHNAASDTCLALDQWAQNRAAHTTLDDILPCIDPVTTQQSLNQSKDVIFELVQAVNLIITTVPNIDPPTTVTLISYNQSGPLVPILCNPLNSDRTERKCDQGEQDLSTAMQVWKNYVCQVSNDVCITVGRLRPAMYDQLASVVNISYGLYHYGPFLTDLADCDFVRDTFDRIHDDYCPKLRKYSAWVYIGLVLVSAAVALSLIFWLLYARERRHRKHTKSADAARTQDPLVGT